RGREAAGGAQARRLAARQPRRQSPARGGRPLDRSGLRATAPRDGGEAELVACTARIDGIRRPQAAGRPSLAEACVAGPGAPRCPRDHYAGTPRYALLAAPPAPWLRPSGWRRSARLRPAVDLTDTVH